MNLVPSTHPALWTVADPVVDFEGVIPIVQELLDLVITYRGAGLAAPQIGIGNRLFVMREGPTFFAVINPVILSHGRDEETEMEGCLSFPG